MQKLAIGPYKIRKNRFPFLKPSPLSNQGFTLIELLVVLLIMGIVLGFAFIATGDFGQTRKIQSSLLIFKSRLEIAQEIAIIETSTLGISIDNNHYRFFRFTFNIRNKKSYWSPLEQSLVPSGQFSANSKVDLVHQDHALPSGLQIQGQSPQLLISSSGEIAPFQLNLKNRLGQVVASLTATPDGKLTFLRSSAPSR